MFISGKELLDRWQTTPGAIGKAVLEQHLPVYFKRRDGSLFQEKDFEKLKRNNPFYNEKRVQWSYYKVEDIDGFELKNQEWLATYCPTIKMSSEDLSAKERRYYGQLKTSKDNVNDAIKASIESLLYCQKEKQPVIKNEFLNFIDGDFPNLPQILKDEIWRNIPRKYKKGSGRPPKTAKT